MARVSPTHHHHHNHDDEAAVVHVAHKGKVALPLLRERETMADTPCATSLTWGENRALNCRSGRQLHVGDEGVTLRKLAGIVRG